jgi:hypothetical protein
LRRVVFSALLLVALFAVRGPAPTNATTAGPVLQFDMSGAQQVPAVETVAWGFVRFFFSDDRMSADYTVDVKGISQTLVLGADLHAGRAGENGPVVTHLADGLFIVTAGKIKFSVEDINEMIAGNRYVSLKTKMHPEGEIRAQIVLPANFLGNPPAPSAPGAPAPQNPAPPAAAPPRLTPPNTGDGGLVR